jgi:Carboxypeptidase regulatory-like domain
MTDHNAYRSIRLAAVLLFAVATGALAQQRPASGLRGTVTDQTGATVAGASVTVESPTVASETATNREGRYSFERLAPGRYSFIVSRSGFMDFRATIELRPGGTSSLDVRLKVAIAVSVNVRDREELSVEPRKNLSGLILTAKDQRGLPDDPRLLRQRGRLRPDTPGSTKASSAVTNRASLPAPASWCAGPLGGGRG